jgi:hypothetical protein
VHVMRADEAYSPPFDERAALEELERLRDAIEASRRRRSQTSDEFEAFVRSFRTTDRTAHTDPKAHTDPATHSRLDARTAPEVRPAAEGRTDAAARTHPAVPMEANAPTDPPAHTGHAVQTTDHADHTGHAAQTRPVLAPTRRTLVPRVLGGAAILVASALLLVRPWKAVRSETTAPPPTAGVTAAAPPTTPPPPAAAPAPAPPEPARTHALEGELNVQRRVWVRVLLDGERTVERELPAGTRIPLNANRAIVIRVGDAGALRLTLNGVDRGPLGKDSEIVTRTFTAPR